MRVGLVNQCFNFNTNYILMLETDMQKLFEANANQANDALHRSVDAETIITSAHYIQYQQFQLDGNFKTYLEEMLQSEHVLRTGIKPTPYQKSYELIVGTQSRVIDFTGENKQFSFFTILLVDDNSDQHRSIYDSYNVERASKNIKSITLENASNTYSTFNSVKFDTEDSQDQFLLYSQIAAWYCKGSNITPLPNYANTPVFQELPTQSEYFTTADEKIFIDLRREKVYTDKLEKLHRNDSYLTVTINIKVGAARKMRLRVTGYFQGKYLYSLLRKASL